jgi:hypothetical protein
MSVEETEQASEQPSEEQYGNDMKFIVDNSLPGIAKHL